jgi:hypothetical protein
MKKFALLMLAALPLILSSCATPPPPQVFHNTDNTAVVIRTTDTTTGQLLQPTMSMPSAKDLILAKVQTLPQHQTAVVILENYTEPYLGDQYRQRGTPWFVALRGLGYGHIVFVQGNNVTDPNGLITLAEYF